MRWAIKHAQRPKTRRTYLSLMRPWVTLILETHPDPPAEPPVRPEYYSQFLWWRTLQYQVGAETLRGHGCAMGSWHDIHGYDKRFQSVHSRKFVKSRRNTDRRKKTVHKFISCKLLGQAGQALHRIGTRPARTAAVNLAFGYSIVGRPGEFTAARQKRTRTRKTLKVHHIDWTDPVEVDGPLRNWSFKLTDSKTDAKRRGRMIFRSAVLDDSVCPKALNVAQGLADLLRERFGSRDEARRHPHAYLFEPRPFVCMTGRELTRWFRVGLEAIGLCGMDYSLGSIRKGAATTLFCNGLTFGEVQGVGGWKSLALLHYLKDCAEWQRDKARALYQSLGPETTIPEFKPSPDGKIRARASAKKLLKSFKRAQAAAASRKAKRAPVKRGKPHARQPSRRPRRPQGKPPRTVSTVTPAGRPGPSAVAVGDKRQLPVGCISGRPSKRRRAKRGVVTNSVTFSTSSRA